MPCQSDEELAQGFEKPNPVTPTKLQRKARACHTNLDAENSECQSDSDEPLPKKKRTRVKTKKRKRQCCGA
jgi:hypothetical protein